MAQKLVVNVPFCDLASEPVSILSKDFSHQNNRLTQLLFCEKLLLLEELENFYKVQALEQLHYTDEKKWHPYEGFVEKKNVLEVKEFQPANVVVSSPFTTLFPQKWPISFGTYLHCDEKGQVRLPNGDISFISPAHVRPLSKKMNCFELVEDALHFLKMPYLWGGRAHLQGGHFASVDCSGLVNLLYRAQGRQIPRDAHPQFLKAKTTSHLKIADLIYLAPFSSQKISHVILKCFPPYFIEAPETGKYVRLLKWGEDIWEKKDRFYFKDRQKEYSFFYRTFSDA